MINSVDFGNRIKKIMDYYKLTASTFAEKIGVQRSSISHILSGRNKPSLDFVLKVTNNFNEVDIHWLIYGKGSFPKQQAIENNEKQSSIPILLNFFNESTNNNSVQKEIKRIVMFYADGTFEEFKK